MGWDIQINPDAKAFPITYDLVELLSEYANDLGKYCYVEWDPRFIARLRAFHTSTVEEAAIVTELIRALEADETAEVLIRR